MEITAALLPSKGDSQADLSLSVSKVKTFDDCKAKYRFNYIEKLPRKEWDFHVFGQFLHSILEEFHGTESDALPHEHMTSCFKIALSEYGPKLTKDQKDEAWNIIDNYLRQMDEEPTPSPVVTDVERGFFIDISLDNQVRLLLNGYIDRIQKDPDGVLHVADYKTTKNKKYLKDFFQLQTYGYVMMLENPELERIRTSFVLLRHDFEYLTKEFTRADLMPVQNKFIEYAQKIHDEKLWRPSPQFLCKFCDFMEECREGREYLEKRHTIKKRGFGLEKW